MKNTNKTTKTKNKTKTTKVTMSKMLTSVNTKTSRTNAVKLITESKGKFFTVTFKKENDSLRTINGNYKAGNTTALGYLTIWSAKDKSYKNVNPRTITSLVIDSINYTVK